MGGPDVKEQEPTAQEVEQFKINKSMWDDYLKHAPQDHQQFMQNETGYVSDDKGNLSVKKGGLLNTDGTVVQDTGQAMAQAQQQWQPALTRNFDPNRGVDRLGRVGLLNKKQASDAGVETNTLLAQQNAPLRGQENVIALGRGNQIDALQGMQSLAGQAAQKAGQDAQSSFADSSANRYLLGTGIGAVGGYYSYKYDKNPGKPLNLSNYFGLLGKQ